jgi:hypothetical protein
LDDAFRRELLRHVPQRKMRRHQDHAQTLGRQHHGDGHIAREMGEILGDSGIAIAGGVQCLLVHWTSDDRIDLTGQCEAGGLLDRPARLATRLFIREPRLPVAAADQPYFGAQRCSQRLVHYLRADAAGIAAGDGQPEGVGCHGYNRTSMYVCFFN